MKRICIFDWAGTLVDKGSYAPLYAFKKTLKQFNITQTDSEINKYMGLDKFNHLLKLTKDIEKTRKIYPILIENMKESITQHSIPIPHVNEIFKYLRSKNYYIGSTSGYNRELLNIAMFTAFKHGMHIPFNVASDEVKNPRPSKDMIYKNFEVFNLNPYETIVVKIGDTIVDIEEGNSVEAFYNIGISSDTNLTQQMYDKGATHVINSLENLFTIL